MSEGGRKTHTCLSFPSCPLPSNSGHAQYSSDSLPFILAPYLGFMKGKDTPLLPEKKRKRRKRNTGRDQGLGGRDWRGTVSLAERRHCQAALTAETPTLPTLPALPGCCRKRPRPFRQGKPMLHVASLPEEGRRRWSYSSYCFCYLLLSGRDRRVISV